MPFERKSEELLDRLCERADIPELDALELPDDWQADQTRDPHQFCATCHWDGLWDGLATWNITRSTKQGKDIPSPHVIYNSAIEGKFCCAVLLALLRKFDVTGSLEDSRDVGSIEFRPHYGLKIKGATSGIKDIYISCHGESHHVPLGARAYSHGRHPSIDPWSDESLAWAKSRIESCVNEHKCHAFQSRDVRLPTRLVFIPNDAPTNGVRLILNTTSLPKDTRYTTLSHCWGKETPPCLTLLGNMDKYATEGVPWTRIPQTFRDAMLYTQRLGLKYIWIDSMCIIQKNDTDWEKESTCMFQYYSNASVTLASTFAADCNGGFVSEKWVRASRLYLLTVKFRGKLYPVYAHRQYPVYHRFHKLPWDSSDHEPSSDFQLFQRAWVFQERLVSPRLLYFTDRQLIFECYDGGWKQISNSSTKQSKQTYKALLSNPSYKPVDVASSWLELLNAYGALQITHAKDKLPAIAAVAKQFLSSQNLPRAPEEEYLCGLRKTYLHIDLSWIAKYDFNIRIKPKNRKEPYLAPSWSWASAPGQTSYDEIEALRTEPRRSTIVLKAEHMTFAGSDRFGQVVGGYITIEGPVIDCVWHVSTDPRYLRLSAVCGRQISRPSWEVDDFIRFWPDYTMGHYYADAYNNKVVLPPVSRPSHLFRFFTHPFRRSANKGRKISRNVSLLQIWETRSGRGENGILVLHKNSKNGRHYRLGFAMCNSFAKFLGVDFGQAECRRSIDIE